MSLKTRTRQSTTTELERQGELLTGLFHVALQLQQAMQADAATAQAHVSGAISDIQCMVASVRSAAFATVTRELSAVDRREPLVALPPSAVVRALPARPPTISAADLSRLLDQSKLLNDRLHRVAIALAITEDLLADTYEQMARSRSRHTEEYKLAAKRARTRAEDFRDVFDRLTAI